MAYGDRLPWPQATDGNGYTLVRRGPAGSAADPCRWRGSANVFGSPGQADPAGGQVVCDAMATVGPDAASQLVAADSGGGSIEINIAAQSVTAPVDLLYKRLDSVPSAPVRFRWAHRAFDLTAYQNGQALAGFSFLRPLGHDAALHRPGSGWTTRRTRWLCFCWMVQAGNQLPERAHSPPRGSIQPPINCSFSFVTSRPLACLVVCQAPTWPCPWRSTLGWPSQANRSFTPSPT